MSQVVALLYRNALLGAACIFVLWPFAVVVPYVVQAPALAVLLLVVSFFVLCIVFGVRGLWRERSRASAALLAFVLIAPYGVLYAWMVERFQQKRGGQQLFERVRAEGSVPATDLADGWDRVCLILPYDHFTDGTLQLDDAWSLEFFRGTEIVNIKTYNWGSVAFVDPPDQLCLPVVQAPAFFVATGRWNPQALTMRPVRP